MPIALLRRHRLLWRGFHVAYRETGRRRNESAWPERAVHDDSDEQRECVEPIEEALVRGDGPFETLR